MTSVRLPRWTARFLIALVLAVIWALPIAWMLVTSFKPESQIVTIPIRWFPEHLSDFTFQNYINVLAIPRGVDLIRSFLNSLTVALIGTALVVIFDTLAAYALARLRF